MFLKLEGDQGNTLEASVTEFVPLDYEELVKIPIQKGGEIAFRVVAKSDKHSINDEENTENSNLTFNIKFPHLVSIFALVEGGWLPPPFVMSKLFIMDRNVVSTLKQLNNGSNRKDHIATEWWTSFLTDKNVLINPVFYALEGCNKKAPTYSEFIRSFDDAVIEIKSALPGVSVTDYQGIHYKAAYTVIEELGDNLSKEADFLLDVVPLIKNRVATKKLDHVKNLIISKAKDRGVVQSLAFLTALSCLYESDQKHTYPVARKIIKPKSTYNKEDAYNALNDLRILQLATSARGAINEKFSVCTQDVALALFWCGLAPMLDDFVGSKVTITFKFSKHLFPRMPLDTVDDIQSALSSQ